MQRSISLNIQSLIKLAPFASLRCLFIIIIFISGLFSYSQSPGGYATGLRFWVKSSAGTFSNAGTNACTNNTALQQWNDQSGNGYNAFQSTSSLRPTYFTNVSNGNPVIRFAGTHYVDVTSTLNIAGNTDYSGFFVVKLTSSTAGGTTDGAGDYVLDRTTATNELFDLKVVASGGTNRFFFQKRSDSGGNLGGPTSTTVIDNSNFQIVYLSRTYNSGGNTISGISVNGVQEATQSNGSETTTPPLMRIGRHATATNGGMNGDLTEIIVYNNVPSTANRRKVESYLAIKYGISLNQSTLRDYFNSAGGVVYPATTTHSAYITNIAGIAQDNTSGLTQSDSKNQNSAAYLRMRNPSSLNDGDYLVWGDNNGSIITPNSADVDGTTIQVRLSKVWRVAHTNNVGTVDVVMDLSAVPGSKSQSDLRLLIDRNGNGFFDNDVTPLTGSLTGNSFTVSGVTFQDGDYFTFGSVNKNSTPLPIELSEFKVNCVGDKITASWTSLTEKKCLSYSVEKSLDGIHFYEVVKVAGAGNSNSKRNYLLNLDSLADMGNIPIYFRLKQIDYDGSETVYPLQYVICESDAEKTISVFPNPSSGQFTILHDESLTEARVENLFGETVYLISLQNHQTSIDLADFPRGFYYLKLLVSNSYIIKKIFIE